MITLTLSQSCHRDKVAPIDDIFPLEVEQCYCGCCCCCQADPNLMSHCIIVLPSYRLPCYQESVRERERERVAVAVAIYLTLGSVARLSRCVYVIIHKPCKGAIIIACCATQATTHKTAAGKTSGKTTRKCNNKKNKN